MFDLLHLKYANSDVLDRFVAISNIVAYEIDTENQIITCNDTERIRATALLYDMEIVGYASLN